MQESMYATSHHIGHQMQMCYIRAHTSCNMTGTSTISIPLQD